ncbi:fluoride efflux transporter CrcB [Jeotgalibacillus proteolyticus]|uniref:fluoride efflux transporter CrcB n=1 Tax=Jeotgalibacillus proteolyticus TaxID=2082395 RepID=UPI003CEFF8C8
MNLLLVSVGGALGAVCRYLMGIMLQNKFPSPIIPTAMLSVNLLGSFGLGLFSGMFYGSIPAQPIQDPIYLLIGIGFFGAFTTFSTFSVEAVQLLRDFTYTKALVYISLTIAGSVLMFMLGLWIGSS